MITDRIRLHTLSPIIVKLLLFTITFVSTDFDLGLFSSSLSDSLSESLELKNTQDFLLLLFLTFSAQNDKLINLSY